MQTLNKDLIETIQGHLPKLVADTLVNRLNEVDSLQKELDSTKSKLSSSDNYVNLLKEDLSKHTGLSVREAALTEREASLNQRELELLRREASLRADVAEAKSAVALDLIRTLVRNPTIRRSVTADVPVAVDGQPASQFGSGICGHVQTHKMVSSTTQEEE